MLLAGAPAASAVAGVIYALTFSHIVPEAFGLTLSIDFLAMIVIGGLGSVGGAALGAVFVIGLPNLLVQYSSLVPFLAEPGSGGVDPGSFARYVYGVLIVLAVIYQPTGLAGLGRLLRRRNGGAGTAPPDNPLSDTVTTARQRVSPNAGQEGVAR